MSKTLEAIAKLIEEVTAIQLIKKYIFIKIKKYKNQFFLFFLCLAVAKSVKAKKKFGSEDLKAKHGHYSFMFWFHLWSLIIYYMNI